MRKESEKEGLFLHLHKYHKIMRGKSSRIEIFDNLNIIIININPDDDYSLIWFISNVS